MSKVFTVGSLFTGFGGLDLGLEQTGRFKIAWQVEIEKYCRSVLTKHWSDVPQFRDVRECRAGDFTRVDVLAGGFPCQDISCSGKRAGMQGERSGLWSHFVRLICELRPRYVIVENVSALLSPIVRDGSIFPAPLSTVLGDLAQSGYDAEWEMLPASAFGAPHIRQRIFLVAYPNSDRPQTLHPQPCIFSQAPTNGHCVLPSNSRGVGTWRQNPQRLLWMHEPLLGRVADGVPYRVERLRGLGNAVVPVIAQYIGECIAIWEDRCASQENGKGKKRLSLHNTESFFNTGENT